MRGVWRHSACIVLSTLCLASGCGEAPEAGEAESHLASGDQLAQEGHYQEALVEYGKAAKLAPNDARAPARAGAALVFLRRDREAVESFERAAALDPNRSAEDLVFWATALQRLGRVHQAVAHYEAALQTDPNHLPAINNLAILLSGADPARSIRLLEKAVRLEPGDTKLVYNLGRAYQKSGRTQEAYNLIQRAVAMTKPNDASYQSRLEHLDRLRAELPRATAPPDAPNVLLILIDTLRADHLSSYGYRRKTSPHIDALGREGVLFENAVSQAPWTAPSVATLFTGLYPSVHGLDAGIEQERLGKTQGTLPVPIQRALSPNQLTLAEILRRHGYHTAGFASNPYVTSLFGFAQGFESYRDPEFDVASLLEPAETVNRAVFDWLDRNHQEPFFLFVHYNDPHNSYEPPKPFGHEYVARYRGPLVPKDTRSLGSTVEKMLRKELSEEDKKSLTALKRIDMSLVESKLAKLVAEKLSEEDLAYLIGLYDGEITYTDAQVDRLLERIRGRKLERGLLTVITADHGEEFFDHGWMSHGYTLYEEQLHVPLIFHYPGKFSPRRVPTQVRLLDVMPTLLEVVGVEAIGVPFQGKSFASLLRGGAVSRTDSAFSETKWGGERRSIRTAAGLKLIETTDADPQLFDLKRDPEEKQDLAASETSAVRSLQDQLRRWVQANRQARAAIYGEKAALQEVVVDEKTKAQLEALGYVGAE